MSLVEFVRAIQGCIRRAETFDSVNCPDGHPYAERTHGDAQSQLA